MDDLNANVFDSLNDLFELISDNEKTYNRNDLISNLLAKRDQLIHECVDQLPDRLKQKNELDQFYEEIDQLEASLKSLKRENEKNQIANKNLKGGNYDDDSSVNMTQYEEMVKRSIALERSNAYINNLIQLESAK